MAIRISGISSGLDTESLVSELVSAYSIKKDSYKKAQTKLSWKQDAWKALNKKVYSLYSNISSLRYSSAYSLKKTTVSDTTKATVTASSSAINGTQKLKINKLAQAGYLTGGNLKTKEEGGNVSSSTKLSELAGKVGDEKYGLNEGQSGTINVNGKEVTLNASDSVANVVTKLKDAGVNASYDSTNNRIFVSSKDSGTANEFTLTVSDENGAKALQSLGLMTSSKSATSAYDKLLSDYGVKTGNTYTGVNTAAIEEAIRNGTLNAASYGDSTYTSAIKTKNYADQAAGGDSTVMDAYKDYTDAKGRTDELNTKGFNLGYYNGLKDLDDDTLGNRYYDKDGNMLGVERNEDGTIKSVGGKEVGSDEWNESGYRLSADGKTFEGIEKTEEDEDGNSTTTFTAYKVGTDFLEDQKDALKAVYTDAADADEAFAKLEADQKTQTDFLSSYGSDLDQIKTVYDASTSGDPNALPDLSERSIAAAVAAFADKVQAAINAGSGSGVYAASEGAHRMDAEDAEITLNGADFKSSSNTFNINGLTINATGVTDQEISITTNTDSQAIYDKVKDFLNQYNDLVNEMNNLYRAPSAKGYEPLTTEEKAALTDTQVEEWEDKVKSALLRKDSTLDSLLSSMTGSMQKSYIMGTNPNGTHITLTAQKDGVTYKGNDGNTYTLQDRGNGKYTFLASDGQTQMTAQGYSWASFGINTLGILNAEENQEFAYHIDGDADDSVTSGKADKLMRAINNDPDAVIDFLKNASSSLYDSINKKMSSTSLRSAYTVYNDKQMGKEYSDYNTTIKKWEDKVAKIEDSYYKKFAAMEKALSTMNSNQTALGGMF